MRAVKCGVDYGSRFLGQHPQTYRYGGLAWTLNHRPRSYQSSQNWYYNNLQDRGDCQNTRKLYKTPHVVGWIVGWKESMNSAQSTFSFPRNSFSRKVHSEAA